MFQIQKNGKERNLGILTVFDRIIQQATVQVLSPIYEKQISETSYGFRAGRSCEKAVIKALEYLNEGYKWTVEIDLARLFDTVDQGRLINIIMKTIKDENVATLHDQHICNSIKKC